MYRRITRNFFYIFSVTLIIFFSNCLTTHAYGSENTSKFIPSDSFLYLNLDFTPYKWKVLHDHKILSDWEAFPPVKNIVKSLEDITGLKIDEHLIYQSEKVGFAISLPEINALLQGKEPRIVGILKFTDKDIPYSIFKNILSSYEISRGEPLLPFENYKGTVIYKFEEPKKLLSFYITVFNNYFLVCNEDSFLKKCLNVYTKTEKGLEDLQVFKTVYDKSAKNKVLWFYLNSEATLTKLRPLAGISSDVAGFVNAFKIYKGLGIGLGFVKNGLELKTYMVANLNEPMVKAMIKKSSFFNETTQFTPPGPYGYFAITGFADLYKYIKLDKLQFQEWENMKDEIYANLGLDLNLFNNILNQSEEIGINCYEATGHSHGNVLLPNITVFFKVKNKAVAENALRQLKVVVENKQIKFGPWLIYRGKKMTLANRLTKYDECISREINFRPAYIFLGNYLVLGLHPGCVMKAIDLQSNPFISLVADINFNDMLMRLGTNKLTSLGYSDFSQIVSIIGKGQKNELETNPLIPYIEMFKRIGINSQNDGKDGIMGTLLIDIDWDKVELQKLLLGENK